jgi:hypothetical protein
MQSFNIFCGVSRKKCNFFSPIFANFQLIIPFKFSISKNEYEKIASAIVELLPGEVISTYFYHEKSYGGKLCCAYRSQRMLLITSNLVEQKGISEKPAESDSSK